MIQFSHLTKKFGSFTAVVDLSFQVEACQAMALWGPNGAGKTTVIKCLLGLLRYDGQIVVDGLDAHKQGKLVRQRLGYVPQELAFYDDLGTLDTARFYARLKQVPISRAIEVLTQVGLSEHANKGVGALSGGMKQRLALGLALLAEPPILVLDEPTSNLDAAARDQFLHLLRDVKAAGKTVIFTSHRLEEIEALADQVLVMDRGKLELTCAAEDLPQRVGLHSQIKLRLPLDQRQLAMNILSAGGFTVSLNGTGLLVRVPAGAKAQPIHLLSQANIHVTDFELE